MSERTKNIAVGLTVLIALITLVGMILIFTTLPEVFRGGYPIRMVAESSSYIEPGYPVNFANIKVGYIRTVDFLDPTEPNRGVVITAMIERKVRLPGNTAAYIGSKGLMGEPYIDLRAGGPQRADPRTGKPLAFFPMDDSIPMQMISQGGGLIPPEVMADLDEIRGGFKEIGNFAKNVNEMLGLSPSGRASAASEPATGPAQPDFRMMMAKLSKALDGLSAMAGDTDNQANLKTSLANLAKLTAQGSEVMDSLKGVLTQVQETLKKADGAMGGVSATLDKAGDSMDRLTAKMMDTADKLSVLMTSLGRILTKLESSDGTAGKLLNDPKLYNDLLEITGQLTGLTKDMRALLESWEKNGVGIKIK